MWPFIVGMYAPTYICNNVFKMSLVKDQIDILKNFTSRLSEYHLLNVAKNGL